MAEKVAKESNIKRLTENIALTYQPLEEGKGLIESSKVDKLDTIDPGAQVNVIEKITLNGEPVTVEAKTAKISIDSLVDGKLEDYIDSTELESALQEYAKKTDLELYAKKEELTALEGRVDGINTRLSSAEEQTAKVPEIEAGLAKKTDDAQYQKDKGELTTQLSEKAAQSDLEALEAELGGYVKREELDELGMINGFPGFDAADMQELWNSVSYILTDTESVTVNVGGTATVNVTSDIETVSVLIQEDGSTYFDAAAEGKVITVTGKVVGDGSFMISADGYISKYILVVVEE